MWNLWNKHIYLNLDAKSWQVSLKSEFLTQPNSVKIYQSWLGEIYSKSMICWFKNLFVKTSSERTNCLKIQNGRLSCLSVSRMTLSGLSSTIYLSITFRGNWSFWLWFDILTFNWFSNRYIRNMIEKYKCFKICFKSFVCFVFFKLILVQNTLQHTTLLLTESFFGSWIKLLEYSSFQKH